MFVYCRREAKIKMEDRKKGREREMMQYNDSLSTPFLFYPIPLYCIVLYYVVLYYIVLYLYCIVLYLYCIVLYCRLPVIITSYDIAMRDRPFLQKHEVYNGKNGMYCIVLYLYCIVLYCIVLHLYCIVF